MSLMTTSSGASPAPSRPAEPRLRLASPYGRTLAGAAAEAIAAAGIDLLPWQREMLADWAAVDADGCWVHRRCGGSIPRQAGKSVGGIGWCAVLAALMGYKVLWTDHNYSTTCEMLSRFRDIFGQRASDPAARHPAFNRLVTRVNNKTAQESFEFRGGGAIAFSTRTKSAALGYSFDVVVYDEAQELTDEQVQAIAPTTASGAKGNPQVIYLGTPTRAGSSATVFQELHDEAWGEDPAPDLCWTEYGVAEVGDVADESRWAEANPSLGALANRSAIRLGLRSGMGELAFAQEYLGHWLPKAASAVLSPGEWAACLIDRDDAPTEGRAAYGVKFAPDGSVVALAAARRPRGAGEAPVHVELVELAPCSGGVGWLADWLAARTSRASCVAVDGLSGADALIDRLAPRVPRRYIVRPRASDAIAAASMMLDAVRERRVTHIEGPALDASATRSTRRKIGSAGGWGWGGDESAAMEAASLALWAVRTSKRDPERMQEASL